MEDVELSKYKEAERGLLHHSNDSEATIGSTSRQSAPRQKVDFVLEEEESDPYGTDTEQQRSRHSKGRRKKHRGLGGSSSGGGDGPGDGRTDFVQYRKPQSKESKLVKTSLIVALPALVLLSLYIVISTSPTHKGNSPKAAPTGSVYASGFNMKNNWGAYSPYFDSGALFQGIEHDAERGVYGMPGGCSFKQVHVLHRHAERLPTESSSKKMRHVAERLNKMKKPPAQQMSWVSNWTYSLGEALLVPHGVGTEFQAGASFWASHGRFLFNASQDKLFYEKSMNIYKNGTKRPTPVLRATTQSRIETSARAWAAGFFGVYGGQTESPEDDDDLYKLVLIPELQGYNNTLAPYLACPNYKNSTVNWGGKEKEMKWVNTYLVDAAERLQKLLPGYEKLAPNDVFEMQKFCAFETAAYGYSGFCELFTETEWRGFEYAMDLNFYGTSSFGSKVGPVSGTGWLAELLARLERRFITEGQFGVNTTYTNDPELFPLDQLFYMDMAHDATIVAALSALGLDLFKKDLPAGHILAPRQFIVSRLTPFGARLFVEVMECGKVNEEDDDQVRLKLNNRILPLGSLYYCPQSKDGLCPLKMFIKSLHHILDNTDYEEVCVPPEQSDVDPESF